MAPYTDDPRRADEVVNPIKLSAAADSTSITDSVGMVGMLFGAISMFTRVPMWAWVAMFCAVSSVMGAKTLVRAKVDNSNTYSGWSTLIFAGTALFSIYYPTLLVPSS